MTSFLSILLLICLITHFVAIDARDDVPVIHLPLARRGSRFSRREPANMTYLADILQAVEAKYAPSYREVQGNRLVRRWWVDDNEDENDPYVLGVAGHRNRW